MSKIKVFIKQPGRAPYSTNIENSLENLQRTVEGYIEHVSITSDLGVIVNEEGMINDLPFNCELVEGLYLFGDIVFVGQKGEEFTDVPISFKKFKKLFPHLWDKEENND